MIQLHYSRLIYRQQHLKNKIYLFYKHKCCIEFLAIKGIQYQSFKINLKKLLQYPLLQNQHKNCGQESTHSCSQAGAPPPRHHLTICFLNVKIWFKSWGGENLQKTMESILRIFLLKFSKMPEIAFQKP